MEKKTSLRFELANPVSKQRWFYTVSIEPTIFGLALVRRWGRGGTLRPRQIVKDYASHEETDAVIRRAVRRRLRKGYRPLEGQTWWQWGWPVDSSSVSWSG